MRPQRSSRFPLVLVGLLILFGALAFTGRALLSGESGLAPLDRVAGSATATPTGQDPLQVARQYFELWNAGRYEEMYAMLSEASRAETTQDRFVTRYRNITTGIGITSIQADFRSPQPDTATPVAGQQKALKVLFVVVMEAPSLGKFSDENELRLVLEEGKWRIDWSPSLIFKDLTSENSVRLLPAEPSRGAIVDRNGKPLAAQGKVLTVGVVPGAMKEEDRALSALSSYLGVKPEAIKARYANARPDWWVPLRDLSLDRRDEAKSKLGNIAGVELREKEARVYPNGLIAAHIVGYMSAVNADDLKTLSAKGYEEGDSIGRAGIEAWAEETLAGQKGGKLIIVGQDGSMIRTVAERQAMPGQNVQLTIDVDVQRKAEEVLGDKVGSIVVLDLRDSSIIALVSHPAFDPNAFVLGISDADWKKLSEDRRLPFQNRPTLSAYPTGSIFKVVTMAAGLEKGGFRPDSQFNSTGQWVLPGTNQVFRDWVPQGHGQLNLVDGLAQSCNIVFYEIGYKLNSMDPNLLPSFARQFGLGEPTGLVGLPEAAGTLPDPEWKKRVQGESWYPGDGVNLAIGQGYLEATPLQMANLYAVLGNGGELRTPLLVKRLGDGPGAKEFTSELKRRLPVSPASLAAIREGMKRAAADPKGTANYAFKGFRVPTAAKTGSAENQNPDAHAWFAGYAPADNPEVVVLVMVEGGRVGGEVAAPLGRSFLEAYFAGRQ